MSSSILSVAIGSRAEHGSSMRITSGSTAIVRAMHRRCCWPPERPTPGWPRRSLTSSHRPGAAQRAPRRARWTSTPRIAGELQPGGDVVEDRHRRERVGLLEDHPDRPPDGDDVDVRRRRCRGRRADSPSACAPGISSCMRLMQRTSVDLPQPDGPIIAVTWFGGVLEGHALDGVVVAVVGVDVAQADAGRVDLGRRRLAVGTGGELHRGAAARRRLGGALFRLGHLGGGVGWGVERGGPSVVVGNHGRACSFAGSDVRSA